MAINEAYGALKDVIIEETSGKIPSPIVELVVDRTLARLWEKGYKVVPLEEGDDEDEPTINS